MVPVSHIFYQVYFWVANTGLYAFVISETAGRGVAY